MTGGIIITHGELAQTFVDVVASIAGKMDDMETIAIGRRDSTEDIFARIREAIARLNRDDGIIIFTDMFGGTPTNIALTFLEEGRIEVIAGVNLPLLLKFVNKREEMSFKELVAKLNEEGRKSIIFASKMLKGKR